MRQCAATLRNSADTRGTGVLGWKHTATARASNRAKEVRSIGAQRYIAREDSAARADCIAAARAYAAGAGLAERACGLSRTGAHMRKAMRSDRIRFRGG